MTVSKFESIEDVFEKFKIQNTAVHPNQVQQKYIVRVEVHHFVVQQPLVASSMVSFSTLSREREILNVRLS
jgi:hypothetical protein